MDYLRKRLLQLFILTSLLLYIHLSTAQAQESIKKATGTWLVLSGNHEVGAKWKVPTVGILRYYNIAEQTEFGFFRTGLTYAPNQRNNFTLGTAYLDTQPFEHNEFETHTSQVWLYEEFCYNTNMFRAKLSQRFRLEQRWISKPDENIFNTRLRYRLQIKHAISEHLYLKAFDEPFLDFTEANINQNRFFLGIGRKLSTNIHVEIGYMKNHIGKNNFDRIRMVFLINTKLHNKKESDLTSIQ